ncbi:conserved hypothetical protein (plasmid) [Borreliella burgdorferi 64b]|nr:conserved hypothetical protein [Borreliella burgdorferi 64b]
MINEFYFYHNLNFFNKSSFFYKEHKISIIWQREGWHL